MIFKGLKVQGTHYDTSTKINDQLVKEIEDAQELFRNTMPTSAKVEIYTPFLMCFYSSRHIEALKWQDMLFQYQSTGISDDTFSYVRIIIFELKLLVNQQYEKAGSRFIDVSSWVESKIADKPFAQVMKKVV